MTVGEAACRRHEAAVRIIIGVLRTIAATLRSGVLCEPGANQACILAYLTLKPTLSFVPLWCSLFREQLGRSTMLRRPCFSAR